MITILHYWNNIVYHQFVQELYEEQKKYSNIKIIVIINTNNDKYDYYIENNIIFIEWDFSNSDIKVIIDYFKIDIIHHHSYCNKINYSYIRECWIKNFYNLHWWFLSYETLYNQNILQFFDWIIVQNTKNYQDIIKKYWDFWNIHQLPIATKKRKSFKKLRSETISFWYLWRLDNEKWLDILYKTFRNLEKKYKNYKLKFGLIKPSTESEKLILNNIKDLKNKEIEINIQDKDLFFKNVDFLIIPSKKSIYETWPMVFYEALSTKTPCIVSDSQEMAKYIKNWINGLIFKSDDHISLEKIIEKILLWKYRYINFSKNIIYNYTIEKLNRDLFKIYWIKNAKKINNQENISSTLNNNFILWIGNKIKEEQEKYIFFNKILWKNINMQNSFKNDILKDLEKRIKNEEKKLINCFLWVNNYIENIWKNNVKNELYINSIKELVKHKIKDKKINLIIESGINENIYDIKNIKIENLSICNNSDNIKNLDITKLNCSFQKNISMYIFVTDNNYNKILENCIFLYKNENIKEFKIDFRKIKKVYNEVEKEILKIIIFSKKTGTKIMFYNIFPCKLEKIFNIKNEELINNFLPEKYWIKLKISKIKWKGNSINKDEKCAKCIFYKIC